jgi:tagaturonate epimerase
MSWQDFCQLIQSTPNPEIDFLRKQAAAKWDEYQVYPNSIYDKDGSILFLIKDQATKKLVVFRNSQLFQDFEGSPESFKGEEIKICPLSLANAATTRKHFPFTGPVPLQQFPVTIGLGDRLGIASPGHLRLIKKYQGVRPVLAQQSIRELNLTGRNYQQVLDSATWAVFQEDYQNGFGADGDHLKTADEVQMALDCGFTMITLDCSEHIDNNIPNLSPTDLAAQYAKLPAEVRSKYEPNYLNSAFEINGLSIRFSEAELQKAVLIYNQAIQHTMAIYRDVIVPADRTIDFEVSIDETVTSTSPSSHFLVAKELVEAGVKVASLAPRFCGEFQKGIDYIGDLHQFETEFAQHVKIAAYFGYKISVHSGSDKFSVFPTVGRLTEGRYHLKTAGTNWLEAMRIIAGKDPALFREIYAFALEHLPEAKKYYHISAVPARVPDLSSLTDAQLPQLLEHNDARQVLHITYGLILQAKDNREKYIFKDRFDRVLFQYETEYYQILETHIGKHLAELGV